MGVRMEDSGPGAPWLRQLKGKLLAPPVPTAARLHGPRGLVRLSVGPASTLATGLAGE